MYGIEYFPAAAAAATGTRQDEQEAVLVLAHVPEGQLRYKASFKKGDAVEVLNINTGKWLRSCEVRKVNYFSSKSKAIIPTYEIVRDGSEVLKSVPLDKLRLLSKFHEGDYVVAKHLGQGEWKLGKVTAVHAAVAGDGSQAGIYLYDVMYDKDEEIETRVSEAFLRTGPSPFIVKY
jgi:hypothetical protein